MIPSFIVISANKRLNYLVDSINECCSLNNTHINISTATISDNWYHYKLPNSSDKGNTDPKSLQNLLANQIARFRNVYNLNDSDYINIFLLENPQTESDVDIEKYWIECFNTIYNNGTITKFNLFRIILSYNVEDPGDVAFKIDSQILKQIINEHKEQALQSQHFNQYMLYVDNQTAGNAAAFLGEKDHKLSMCRFMFDFMCLVSSGDINLTDLELPYNILSAGFAEYMYYYPDIKNYFQANYKKELYKQLFEGNFSAATTPDNPEFNIDINPTELKKRSELYKQQFGNVPFDEDINLYTSNVDYDIDYKIRQIKTLLEKLLAEKRDKYLGSQEIINIDNEIISLQNSILINNYDSSTINEKIKSLKEKRSKLIKDNCPEYIDRIEIYTQLLQKQRNNNFNKDSFISDKKEQYKRLLDYICSTEFNGQITAINNKQAQKPEKKKECFLKRFWNWLFPNKNDDEEESTIQHHTANYNDIQSAILKILNLKEEYRTFANRISELERKFKDLQDYVKSFKLTEHSHSVSSIIDINKLKKAFCDTNKVYKIIQNYLQKNKNKRILSDLVADIEECGDEMSRQYKILYWTSINEFIADNVRDTYNLSDIINQLIRKSSPFVNYNYTENIANNDRNICVFSDISDDSGNLSILDFYNICKNNITKGSSISPKKTEYATYKICMMQIIPFTDDIINNLTDLQEYSEETNLSNIISTELDDTDDDTDNGNTTGNRSDDSNSNSSNSNQGPITKDFWGSDTIHNDDKCIICHKGVNGEYFVDWAGNKACVTHKNELVQCASCFQYCTSSAIDIGAGQKLCSRCQKNRVKSEDTKKISDFINSFYENWGLSIVSNWTLKMISAEEMLQKTGNTNTRGLAESFDNNYTIYIYRELSRVQFAKTLAHEMLHIYQYQHNIESSDKAKYEGFCNLGSYQILKQINNVEARAAIKNLKESDDPIYGDGFRTMLGFFENGGWTEAISKLK